MAEHPDANRTYRKKYRAAHLDTARAAAATWRAKHPDAAKRNSKAWREKNPERSRLHRRLRHARERAGPGLTVDEVNALLKKPCHYCGDKAAELDHVVPVSRGGKNTSENVVPSCASCNHSKSNRTPEEWRAGKTAPRLPLPNMEA